MRRTLLLSIMPNKTPFLGAALICERVIQEADGVLTAMRIVDTFTVPARPNLPPEIKQGIEFTVLVMLKSGDVRGKSKVAIKLRYPSGKIKDMGENEIVLEGEHRGANLVARTKLAILEWGLHWFDVSWDGQMLTSVPFSVVRESTNQVPTESAKA